MMTIRYINSNGEGFNGRTEVDEDTTVGEFFDREMPGQDWERFNVHVNNVKPPDGRDYVLRSGDLVSIIPAKYAAGAFGGDFLNNLKAAAQLGAVVRETPDLVSKLQAVNDLGVAIQATPGLAENIRAVIAFVTAVQVLDTPGADEAILAGADTSDMVCLMTDSLKPIRDGETIGEFFARVKPEHSPRAFRIEVNGSTVEPDYVLMADDHVLIWDINEFKARLARPATTS